MNVARGMADFLFEVGHLSSVQRSGFQLLGTDSQNVAEHSFRTAWIGYLLARMDEAADAMQVVMMCLLHDLPETRIGDLNPLSKTYLQVDANGAARDQLASLPFGAELESLWHEYSQSESRESIIAHDADQLELLLTLREQESRGQTRASDWLDRVAGRLQLESSRHLAQAIVGGDPSRWWEAIDPGAPTAQEEVE